MPFQLPNLQNISAEINKRISDAVSGLLNLGKRTSVPPPLPNRQPSIPKSIPQAQAQTKSNSPKIQQQTQFQPQSQLRFPVRPQQRPSIPQRAEQIQQQISSYQKAAGMTPKQIQSNPFSSPALGNRGVLPVLSVNPVPGSLRSLQAGVGGEASVRPLLLKFNDAYGSTNVKTVVKAALDILKQPTGSVYDDYKMNTIRMVLRKFPEAVSAFSQYTSGL